MVLPIAALLMTSLQRFATADPAARRSGRSPTTRRRCRSARCAPRWSNSLMLGFGVATVGVRRSWRCWSGSSTRSQLVGRGAIEYLVMFPQAVPRLVFGLALLWAWLNIPIPIYGTLWLLALAYFTVDAAARRAHAGRRGAADRQEPRGMRRASAAPAGSTRCAPSPCRCSSPASWRRGC